MKPRLRIIPASESKYLAIELVWKAFGPPQFVIREVLCENTLKTISGSDILIACCLINECNDTNASKTSNEDLAANSDMTLGVVKSTCSSLHPDTRRIRREARTLRNQSSPRSDLGTRSASLSRLVPPKRTVAGSSPIEKRRFRRAPLNLPWDVHCVLSRSESHSVSIHVVRRRALRKESQCRLLSGRLRE